MTELPVEPAGNIVTLIDCALDESREARDLVRVCYDGLSRRTKRWEALIRTRESLTAGAAVQYLGENLHRANERWRACIESLGELDVAAGGNEVVRDLTEALRGAGLHEVRSSLDERIVPRQRAQAAEHLRLVLGTMSDCDVLMVRARSAVMLRRMRDQQP